MDTRGGDRLVTRRPVLLQTLGPETLTHPRRGLVSDVQPPTWPTRTRSGHDGGVYDRKYVRVRSKKVVPMSEDVVDLGMYFFDRRLHSETLPTPTRSGGTGRDYGGGCRPGRPLAETPPFRTLPRFRAAVGRRPLRRVGRGTCGPRTLRGRRSGVRAVWEGRGRRTDRGWTGRVWERSPGSDEGNYTRHLPVHTHPGDDPRGKLRHQWRHRSQ